MRNTIDKHQKFNSLALILDKYSSVFEDKPEGIAAKTAFTEKNNELSTLINTLIRPVSTVYRQKQDGEQKLREAIKRLSNIGLIIATRSSNMPMVDLMIQYRSKSTRVAAFKLAEIARHLHQELQIYQNVGADLGLTPEILTTLNQMASEFSSTLGNTGFLLSSRKSDRKELKALLSACNTILKMQLDPYITYLSVDHPDLFREYMMVRTNRKGRKSSSTVEKSTADIAGTVTDSSTGLPLNNATINLIELDTVLTSDEDGYFQFDELPAGKYTISCHAFGYHVPPTAVIQIKDDESLVMDFSLVSIANNVENPAA